MAHLSDQDIKDLVTGTLNELGPPRFMQIAQNLQDYECMSRWLRKDRVVFDQGIGIKRTLMMKLSGAAKHVGLYEVDETNVGTLLTSMNIPWRHALTHWAFERREMLENRGRSMVTNVIQPRRVAGMIDLAEELEDKAWQSPGAGNETDPYGIPYWIVKNATEGFNGGAPTGHTTVANVSPTTYAKWKNWTSTYTDVTKPDLIKTMKRAFRKTKFKSPVAVSEYVSRQRRDRYRIYVNETTISNLEDVYEAQNENLGRNIISGMDNVNFKGHPFVWVPQIDSDTAYPVYMIDHSVWFPVILRGDYLRETDPEKAAKQHNVYEVFVDLSYNYLCLDRRANAIVYVA